MNSFTKQFIALALVASIAGGAVVAYPGESAVDTVTSTIRHNPALRCGLLLSALVVAIERYQWKDTRGVALRASAVTAILAAVWQSGTGVSKYEWYGKLGQYLREAYLIKPQLFRLYTLGSIVALTRMLVKRGRLKPILPEGVEPIHFGFDSLRAAALIGIVEAITGRVRFHYRRR